MATLSTSKTATGTYYEPVGALTYTATARVTIIATYTITTSNSAVSITATKLTISSISYGGSSHPQAQSRAASSLQSKLSNNITLTFNNQQVFTRASNSPNTSYTVSGTKSVNRTKTNQNVNLVLDGSSISINIPAKPSYTISYNMNGGVGNIANQTKWHDETLTLSSTKPTREGYTFLGWSGSNSVNYAAGGTIAAGVNQAVTLTARWHQNPSCTYEIITIDPYYNGGKDYSVNITGVTLYDSATLSKLRLDFGSLNAESTSSTVPTSSSPITLSVSPNTIGTFTPTISITDSLGATSIIYLNNVTVKQYTPSSITIDAERVNSSGIPSEEDSGNDIATYGLITVTFNIPSQDYYPLNNAPTITFADENTHSVTWYSTRDPITQQISGTVTWNTIQTGDTVYALINNCELLSSYTFFVTPYDNRSSGTTKSTTISQVFYTIDFLAGGHGVAFGMPSTEAGFHCGLNAHFYEKALDDSGVITVHLMPNNEFDWNSTRDSTNRPATSQYGVGYGIVDSQGVRTSNLDTHMYDDGRLATVLGAHRIINDEDVRNQLYLNIGDDGSISYGITDSNAFKNALGLNNLLVDANQFSFQGTNTSVCTVNTSIDASKTNNDVSTTLWPNYQILDKSRRILTRYEGVINSNGSIGFQIYARQYNTSGTMTKQAGIAGHIAQGATTMTYTVTDPANFRSAIGAAASSDRRLKTNLIPLGKEAVQFVKELKPYSYTINNEKQIGFIAQDIYKSDKWNTHMAFETKEGIDGLDDWEVMSDGSPTWKLDYIRIIPALTAALQDSMKRIDELETTIKELKTTIEELKK